MKRRNITTAIAAALKDTPVTLVNGARQTGKTTLVRDLARKRKATYITLDDHSALDAALNDPAGFVASLGAFAVVDEVQNAPNIFRAIKASVDRDRRPGRFLLTGSANVLALPRVGDSLAGRMEIITLHPFAQDELANRRSTFIDALFKGGLPLNYIGTADRTNLARRVFAGGYPEVRTRKDPARRAAWYKAYITTILQKDVREIVNIADLTALPKLLTQLALRSSGLLNLADVARDTEIPHTTLRRYMALLETTFLFTPLLPWSNKRAKRLVKAPKIHLADSGFAAWLCGTNSPTDLVKNPMRGHLLESFTVNEVRKLASWAKTPVECYHFRMDTGKEVDLVLEDASGRIIGIEVKSSASIDRGDFTGLIELRNAAGKNWARGIVLHSGPTLTPFAKDLHAVPMSALWEW
ncbi:MAG: ATP-binding protein [Flavobacteriales bacterium]